MGRHMPMALYVSSQTGVTRGGEGDSQGGRGGGQDLGNLGGLHVVNRANRIATISQKRPGRRAGRRRYLEARGCPVVPVEGLDRYAFR